MAPPPKCTMKSTPPPKDTGDGRYNNIQVKNPRALIQWDDKALQCETIESYMERTKGGVENPTTNPFNPKEPASSAAKASIAWAVFRQNAASSCQLTRDEDDVVPRGAFSTTLIFIVLGVIAINMACISVNLAMEWVRSPGEGNKPPIIWSYGVLGMKYATETVGVQNACDSNGDDPNSWTCTTIGQTDNIDDDHTWKLQALVATQIVTGLIGAVLFLLLCFAAFPYVRDYAAGTPCLSGTMVLWPLLWLMFIGSAQMVLAGLAQTVLWWTDETYVDEVNPSFKECDPSLTKNQGGYTDASSGESFPNKCGRPKSWWCFSYDLWGTILRAVYPVNEYTENNSTNPCPTGLSGCSNWDIFFDVQVSLNILVGILGLGLTGWAVDMFRTHEQAADWGKLFYLSPREREFKQLFTDLSVAIDDFGLIKRDMVGSAMVL